MHFPHTRDNTRLSASARYYLDAVIAWLACIYRIRYQSIPKSIPREERVIERAPTVNTDGRWYALVAHVSWREL